MRYSTEVDVKEVLGIESWRNLSKDTFLRFLAALPEMDKEVALQLVGQIPEITSLAKDALDDAGKAYDGLLVSNARSMEMNHQVRMERLAILRAELAKDLSPEERLRVLDDLREVHASADQQDSENKKFIAEQFDKRLGAGLVVAAAIAATVVGVAKSGGTRGGDVSRLFAA